MKKIFTISILLFIFVTLGIAQACPEPSPINLLRICTQKTSSAFIVKDFIDKTSIAGATIDFVSLTNQSDTLRFVANEFGIINTKILQKDTGYNMIVSSVGYKPYFLKIKNNVTGMQVIFMERDEVSNEEVVVVSAGVIRCYSSTFICSDVLKIAEDSQFGAFAKVENKASPVFSSIFPNPVQRGENITLKISSEQHTYLQTLIIDITGKIVWKQILKLNKSLTSFSINIRSLWSAGTYFLSLRDNNGKILKTEKFIVL